MVNAGEVVSEVRADMDDFDSKMRKMQRELEKADQDAKKRARSRGAAVAGGIAGAVAGAVVGAAQGSGPVQAVLDLLVNLVAAAMLPLILSILPLIEAVAPVLTRVTEALAPGIQVLATKVAALIEATTGPDLNLGVPVEVQGGGTVPAPPGTPEDAVAVETGRNTIIPSGESILGWFEWLQRHHRGASSARSSSVLIRGAPGVGGWFG